MAFSWNIFKKAAEIGADAAHSRHAEKIYNTIKVISAISDETENLAERIAQTKEPPRTIIQQTEDSVLTAFEDPYLDQAEAAIAEASKPENLTNAPYNGKRERNNGKTGAKKTEPASVKTGDDPPEKHSPAGNGRKPTNSNFTAEVDSQTGTITQRGYLKETKGNHKNMPKRTGAYLDGDERGHIQASASGGDNSRLNVVPQAKDLNHGAYYQMELGERDALKANATVYSEKIAYSSGGSGSRPDAFMVNDTITHADGRVEQVHLSFANLSNEEQEAFEKTASEHTDMLHKPEMTAGEYAEYNSIMDEIEGSSLNIRDEYGYSDKKIGSDKKNGQEEDPSKKTKEEEAPSKKTKEEEAPSKKAKEEEDPSKKTKEEEDPSKKTKEEEDPSKKAKQEEAPSKKTKEEEVPSKKTKEEEDPSKKAKQEEDPSKQTKQKNEASNGNKNNSNENQKIASSESENNKNQPDSGKKPASRETTPTQEESSGSKTENAATDNRTAKQQASAGANSPSQARQNGSTSSGTSENQKQNSNGNQKDDGMGR